MSNVSVKVKHRKSKVTGKQSPLCIQLIYRRKMKRIPLDIKVYESEWSPSREMVQIPPGTDRTRSEYLLQVSETIDKTCSIIRQIVDEQPANKNFSVDDIAMLYKERTTGMYLSAYIQKQSDTLMSQEKIATARHYRSLEKSFYTFTGKNTRMDEIDETLIRQYGQYLKEKGLMDNTISFYMRNFRTILNKASADGLIKTDTNLFKHVNTRIEKTQKRAVEEKVITAVKKLSDETLQKPGLILSRDLLMFSYYTRGMAFIDIAYLTRDNIKGNYLIYQRHKTGQELRIRILPEIQTLIDRYRSGSSYLFPILRTPESPYKEYESALRLQNLRLKKIGQLVNAKLSTYVARHTWASTAKSKGVTDEMIADSMGHHSVKTTRIYITTFDHSRLDRINKYVISEKKKRGSLQMFNPVSY